MPAIKSTSPLTKLMAVLAYIMVGEILVMLAMHAYLPEDLPNGWISLLDAMLLILIVFPLVFYFFYRPLVNLQNDLEDSEERMRLLLENSPEAIYEIGKDGKILFANSSCVRMLGYASAGELVGQDSHTIFHYKYPDGAPYPIEDCPVHKAHSMGEGVHTDSEVLWRADGTCFPVEFWSYPVVKDGEATSSVVSFVDITERKKSEEDIRRSNETLKKTLDDLERTQTQLVRAEKLASLGALSAGVAHEIKNPLNIISTSIELVRMYTDVTGELNETYETIFQQINRIVKITENLREFAKERAPEIKDVEIHEFVEKTIMLMEYEMRTENIEIIREFSESPIVCRCDPDQIAQVFLNLISNARDSINMMRKKRTAEQLKKQGWTGVLTISTSVNGKEARISFKDTGIGIPREFMTRIFDPFFSTKDDTAGTGLGLSISYGLVENHGGRIEARSEEGKGAEFTVLIPISQSDTAPSHQRRKNIEHLDRG